MVRDLDTASGGPSRSVPALARAQARQHGAEVRVLYGDRGRHTVPLDDDHVRFIALGRSGSGLDQALGAAPDGILHLHGLWSPLLHRAARRARRLQIPYVVSVRGMLTDWAMAHRPWRKRVAWRLYQQRDLAGAACLLGSSAFEQAGIAARLPGQRVEVIPNGCDPMPETPPGDATPLLETGVRWALGIGRLHRVKGYAELIDAWARLRPRGWKLAIAGPDEGGYRAELERRIAEHNLAGEVTLLGAVDDARKWALLARCELFVAPSHTENFGMAIAEALQAGRPVLTTQGTPWRELAENGCGWWIEPGPAALDSALREATASGPQALEAMGQRGRILVREKYSWEGVARQTLDLYRSLLGESAE